MKEFHAEQRATVTGPLRLTMSLDDHPDDESYDDVFLFAGETVTVLYPTDDQGDVYVTGDESGNSQYIAATSLTLDGEVDATDEDNITLRFAYPNGDEVQIRVTGFSAPEYGLAALLKAGSIEVLEPLAADIQADLEADNA